MQSGEAKIVFLGESTVGKTSIVACFAEDGFSAQQSPTIGACFSLHEVAAGDETIKLKVWDTAGQERFRSLTPMYYRDAQVAVLVFAVNDRDTLDKLASWIERLESDTNAMPSLIITGNKTDLDRDISYAEGEQFARNAHATYVECSAKNETGIRELFSLAAEKAIQCRQARVYERRASEVIVPIVAQNKSCC
jgi:small GTP-binding protein